MRHDICPNCRNDLRNSQEEYCPHCGTLVTLTGREMRTQQLALLYAQAKAAIFQQDRQEAVHKLIAVLSLDPDYKDAPSLLTRVRLEQLLISYDHRARYYNEQKQWEKARQCYCKILQKCPQNENAASGLRQIDRSQLEEKLYRNQKGIKPAVPFAKYILILLILVFFAIVLIGIITLVIGFWT